MKDRLHLSALSTLFALILSAVALAVVSPMSVAQATPITDASITISGSPVSGREYLGYQVADYVNILQNNGKPVGVGLQTVATSNNIGSITLCDNSTISNKNFKQVLAAQIACLENARNGSSPAPAIDAEGNIEHRDPLVWATAQWQMGANTNDSDPWLNPDILSNGPLKTLVEWMADNIIESPGCTPGVDSPCFGLPNASKSQGTKNPGQVQFTGLIPGIYLVFPTQAVLSSEDLSSSTIVAPMLVGTKIPVTDGAGITTLMDLYKSDGIEIRRYLGVLNAKGDEVNITININDPVKKDKPTFGIGDTVPYIVTAVLPNFDAFNRKGNDGSYTGETSNVAFKKQSHGGGASASRPEPFAASHIPAIFKKDSGKVILSDAESEPEAENPVRFDIAIDYSSAFSAIDVDGSNPKIADVHVLVGSTELHYSDSCVLGVSNTSDPCFGFVQGLPNAGGEVRETIQLPSWILRANGGADVEVTFEQQILHTVNDDAASPLEAYDELDGGPWTKDWSVASAMFSSNPGADDYTDFSMPTLFATAKAREVSVFTFPIVITKVDSHTNQTLAGAEFTLSQGDEQQCFINKAGKYTRIGVAPCEQSSDTLLQANSDGRIEIIGLEAHVDYTVKETKQPDGYDPGNLDMVEFTVQVSPVYDSDSRPTEVLATEYIHAGASFMHSTGLPSYIRPATTEWVDDVNHVKHTFYAHEIDILNGKTSQDVAAITPISWKDTLAKTGIGILLFLIVAMILMVLGMVMKRKKKNENETENEAVAQGNLISQVEHSS